MGLQNNACSRVMPTCILLLYNTWNAIAAFSEECVQNLSMECCYSIYLVVSSALDWLLVYSCKSEKRATVIYIVLSFTRRYSCNKINIIVAIDALSSNIVTELEWKREALEYFWLCSRIQ